MAHAQSTNEAPPPRPNAVANYPFYIIRGVLAVMVGICALLFPISAIFVFTIMFAGWCLADGLLALATALRGRRGHGKQWWALILRGILGVLVAAAFIAAPGAAVLTYATFAVVIAAIWALFAGLLEIATAIRLRRAVKGEWPLILSGILSVVLSALLLGYVLFDPAATLISAASIIGIYLVLSGAALLLLGNSLKTLLRREGPGAEPLSG